MAPTADYETLPGGAAGERLQRRPVASSSAMACAVAALCAAFFAAGRRTAVAPASRESFLESSGSDLPLWKPPDLPLYRPEPLAKKLIRHFDYYLMNQAAFDAPQRKLRNVGQWLGPEFVYDTVGFPNSFSLEGWVLSGEESGFRNAFPISGFSQMLFFGDSLHATTTSYGNVRWQGELFGISPPNNWTYFRVTDFYLARKTLPNETFAEREGLIKWNFMMIDWADLLRRVGRPVLPKARLPEGLFLSSAVNDGVPAPLSVVAASRDTSSGLRAASGALHGNWAGNQPAEQWWQKNLTFYGPGGIGMARNATEFDEHVLEPYRVAFANRSVDEKMLFCEGNYCASFGHLVGRHVGTWVGQPASHQNVAMRYAMHWRVVDDKIAEGWAIFDIPGFFKQIGKDFWAEARNPPAALLGSL